MARDLDSPQSPAAAVTPMMAQYLAIKAQAQDALLFYRMGDFYELFFEDAQKAAQALDIALTKRGKHEGADIPMCGVPVATAETYLARLIKAGFRVAVCEQTEDPKEAKKRGAKAVVAREIIRYVTPGTLTEDALLDARAANYLLSVAPAAGHDVGLAWADLSSGAVWVSQTSAADLPARIAALNPSELLAAEHGLEALPLEWRDRATLLAKTAFDPRSGARRLAELYAVSDIAGLGDWTRGEAAALGALADYLLLTQVGRIPALSAPRRLSGEGGLAIDPATRASLEIDRTLRGERVGSLLDAVDRTVTAPGARALADRLARPLTDLADIRARQDACAFFLQAPAAMERLRAALKAAPDMARALSRLSLDRGGPRDLAAVSAGLASAPQIGALFADRPLASPPEPIADALAALTLSDKPELAGLAQDLKKALAPDPPLFARDGGFIAPGWNSALDQARALRDDSRRIVAGLQAQYAEASGVTALKIKHNNVLGYFIEVSARHGDALMNRPETFIHRQTLANAVRFTTTELADLDAQIAGAGERALAIELGEFQALASRASELGAPIRAAAEALAALDVAAASALWAEETNACRPIVEAGTAFALEAGRHPVVERALATAGDAPFTPNDCHLDGAGAEADRLVFVTGPNMAGKSTFLRQNALAVILAQAGLYVPARSARLGVVDRLFSRVGAADDLARGRSTFMAEMIETAAILNQATERSFVILDEVGRGTATYDGLSIAWAAAEHVHDVNRCRALFATHYHELTELADRLDAAGNLCLKAKEWKGELIFLHEVAPGAADRSYGVEVARRAGLPKAVVKRAAEVLSRLEGGAQTPKATLTELPLFAAPPEPEPTDPVKAALDALDPDALTPRAALDALYDLKRLLEEASG
ncbi:MAG: DNA mismatch repair protein MutS [Maricaulaceae bacterium]